MALVLKMICHQKHKVSFPAYPQNKTLAKFHATRLERLGVKEKG